MALTKIKTKNIKTGSISSAKIVPGAVVVSKPKITNIAIANSTYHLLDDTAVSTDGGYIVITGSGFDETSTISIDQTSALSVTYVNSTTLRAQVDSASAATYNLYVVNDDGSVGIKVNGLTYSSEPVWATGSTLTEQSANDSFSINFSASEAITYSNTTALPAGTTLLANGYFYGTITDSEDTTYTFTILATDTESQEASRSFDLTVTVGDEYFKNTILLLQADNATSNSNNNIFVDSSDNNLTITRSGETTQTSFSPFNPSGWSNYFDGDGDYLEVTNTSAFDFGTGDFTIEAFINISQEALTNPDGNRQATIMSALFNTGVSTGWNFYINGNSTTTGTGIGFSVYDNASSSNPIAHTYSFTKGIWYHVAIVRSGNNFTLYINGVSSATSTNSINVNSGGFNFKVGALQTGGAPKYYHYFPGHISNVRVVKGTALYTSNFTPTTSNLTNVSGTSFLSCQNNKFIDNSTNAYAITINGETKISNFSPFAPSAKYNAATHGASIYFDGNGDYLTIPTGTSATNFGTGDFTIEFWIFNENATTGNWNPILAMGGTGGGQEIRIGQNINGGGYGIIIPNNSNNGDRYFSYGTLPLRRWHHIALVRNGSNVRFYRNGIDIGGVSDAAFNFTNTGDFKLADNHYDDGFFTGGYISDLRIVKGTAVYTTAFTPPTEPLQKIANTSLLLKGSNFGIYDATTKNTLITVSGANVNTSIKKYGTGSMYFNGSSDQISIPHSSLLDLGTSNFTIEFWLYAVSWGSGTGGVIGKKASDGTNGWQIYRNSTNASKMSARLTGTNDFYTNSTISTGVWVHWALVRTGSTLYWFKDGILDSTGSSSANIVDTSASLKIGYADTWSAYANFYMDDLRITKGVARYTSNFTPPTSAHKAK